MWASVLPLSGFCDFLEDVTEEEDFLSFLEDVVEGGDECFFLGPLFAMSWGDMDPDLEANGLL